MPSTASPYPKFLLHDRLQAIALETLEGLIEATGRGERDPLVSGDSEADHRVNRRREVQVVCDG